MSLPKPIEQDVNVSSEAILKIKANLSNCGLGVEL
jgi:hypothetical protein